MFRLIKKIFSSILFQHLLFWAVICLLMIYPEVATNDTIEPAFQSLFSIIYVAFAVYVNLIFLIPRYLRKKKYIIYIAFQLLNILIFVIFDILTLIYLFNRVISKEFIDPTFPDNLRLIIWVFVEISIVFIFISITTFLKFLRDWVNMQDKIIKIKEIEKQRLQAELNSLKSQINPHFLFNTLNNLYSLALYKSEETPGLILKLSDLMRYIIYDCRANRVSIQQEIDFINNYISLEKLRLGEQILVSLNIVGDTNKKIAPLIFINLVENAFKHCKKSEDSFIKIDFDIENQNVLIFSIENSCENCKNNSNNPYSGIGIQNVKKRLELLYPKNAEMIISNENNVYKIILKIKKYE